MLKYFVAAAVVISTPTLAAFPDIDYCVKQHPVGSKLRAECVAFVRKTEAEHAAAVRTIGGSGMGTRGYVGRER